MIVQMKQFLKRLRVKIVYGSLNVTMMRMMTIMNIFTSRK
ncbi:hypothetical protein CHCC20323_0783 [Bacillus licheniformis]|nr:hypothetical protein CHCC20323_0783 [Bacillus licheniformis]